MGAGKGRSGKNSTFRPLLEIGAEGGLAVVGRLHGVVVGSWVRWSLPGANREVAKAQQAEPPPCSLRCSPAPDTGSREPSTQVVTWVQVGRLQNPPDTWVQVVTWEWRVPVQPGYKSLPGQHDDQGKGWVGASRQPGASFVTRS